jgi:hypothetical protein
MLHYLSMDVHKKSHPDNAMPYARNLTSSNPAWPEAKNKSPCMLMSSDVYIQIKRSAAAETTLGRRWKDALRIVCWAFSGSFVKPQLVPIPCPIPSCRGPVECALEWCARKTFACRHFETLKEAFQLAHPYPGATLQLETNSYCAVRFLKFLSRHRTVLKVAARFLVGLCVNMFLLTLASQDIQNIMSESRPCRCIATSCS